MDSALPQLAGIDPSGGVESLGNHAVVVVIWDGLI
jgi:hypothetical protein